MQHKQTEETLAKYPEYVTRNNLGDPILNRPAVAGAPDKIYFELNPDDAYRFRELDDDCSPLMHPSGTKLYCYIDRDGDVLAVYAVDSRVRFSNAVGVSAVLTLPPAEWDLSLRQAAGVGHVGKIIPSVLIPFV